MTPREDFPITFLLVEDDEIDAAAFCRALSKSGMTNPVRVARDGHEALEVLRGSGSEDALSPPYLVLLDLNTPRMTGHEFLDELRADDQLAHTVVFVLTSSDAPDDRRRAYNRHVAGYLLKPSLSQGFEPLLQLLDAYWRAVQLPG